jgi:hypothetical protein
LGLNYRYFFENLNSDFTSIHRSWIRWLESEFTDRLESLNIDMFLVCIFSVISLIYWEVHHHQLDCMSLASERINLWNSERSEKPHILTSIYNIHLWSKVGCLFCLYLWDPPNKEASDSVLGLFGKLSTSRGAWARSMTFGLAVQKFLSIEWLLHWKLIKL